MRHDRPSINLAVFSAPNDCTTFFATALKRQLIPSAMPPSLSHIVKRRIPLAFIAFSPASQAQVPHRPRYGPRRGQKLLAGCLFSDSGTPKTLIAPLPQAIQTRPKPQSGIMTSRGKRHGHWVVPPEELISRPTSLLKYSPDKPNVPEILVNAQRTQRIFLPCAMPANGQPAGQAAAHGCHCPWRRLMCHDILPLGILCAQWSVHK